MRCPRILIIDDNERQAQNIADRLQDEGCEVTIVRSETEAITFLGCQHYDVALIELDNKMTLSGVFAFGQKMPRELIRDFCERINVEHVTIAARGHTDTTGILAQILDAASTSLSRRPQYAMAQ